MNDLSRTLAMNKNNQNYSRKITSFIDLKKIKNKSEPIGLMYSGGLDSTYALYKLSTMGFTNIHAISINIGQNENFDETKKVAEQLGAHFHHLDKQNDFANLNILPAIQMGAKYLGHYPISSSLSRPLIADTAVQLSNEIGITTLIHTANLSQNSLPRLNNRINASNFIGNFGSPYIHSAITREQKCHELKHRNLHFISQRKLSGDSNLWCNEYESGPLDDPENFIIPDDIFTWTQATNTSTQALSITIEKGIPIGVNNDQLPILNIINSLNKMVGSFGHGRYAGLEHLANERIKVLEVREAPAAMILFDAYAQLESATLDIKSLELKQYLSTQWVIESVNGHWGSIKHKACQAAVHDMSTRVSGVVTYIINPSRFFPISIKAKNPLYIRDRDTWEIKKAKEGSYYG
ncbi:Argininosuccinate synthase [Halomonadaceae bacterium LMG 33818]|uniref:argininosuccinate synthase-related protein n=1 Tax=Cernens ardua TaxID=3402176 RepID=UPI003EDB7DA3